MKAYDLAEYTFVYTNFNEKFTFFKQNKKLKIMRSNKISFD